MLRDRHEMAILRAVQHSALGELQSGTKKVSHGFKPCRDPKFSSSLNFSGAAAGQIHIPLATHLGAVGNHRKDVLTFQLRVVIEDFFERCTGSEEIKNQRTANAGAA